jgi:hypothetical protein
MIFVADSGNNMIRTIAFNPQPQPVLGPELGVDTYAGVTINGFVGRTYRIERSADMANWNLRATVLLTASPYFWIDQSPVRGKQFYRAFLLP